VSKQSSVNKRIQSAQKVIRTEQAGLEALNNMIDEEFSHAVDLVLQTKGYLIVVGVGKSGHIGQKIAASFASTGTRSFFMHPTEASHGDLGMVSPNSQLSEFMRVIFYACRPHPKPVQTDSPRRHQQPTHWR